MWAGAVSKVYDSIYQEIVSGERPPGSAISEMEVSSKLNVSRSPVREALKIMQTEELVTYYPGRGNFVTVLTQQDIEEIFDLRELFELTALKNACQYMPKERCDSIEKMLLELTEQSSADEYYAANSVDHTYVINSSGNTRLVKFYNQIIAQMNVINRISSRSPTHFRHSTEYHLKIIRAIRNKNEEEARQALAHHLGEVRRETISNFVMVRFSTGSGKEF